ncbi:hypothetical protein [uncultured Psychroserpens sp.]|uniref:hypothetical protein n=1 Tax=uncultured Psychroserpens sp. TaxID=255436 RepID=UPI0026194A0D|nr:hypothetical protein [uncultured Psychroserpens sp.]
MKKAVIKLLVIIMTTGYTTQAKAISVDASERNKDDYFNVHFEGNIIVAEDDKSIISISNYGFIEIKQSSFGVERRLVIKSDNNGGLIEQFFIKNEKQNFVPKGKKWLSKVLPKIIKTTFLGGKSRVDRSFKKGGVNAVLKTIEDLSYDFVKSKYIDFLLKKQLSVNELNTILKNLNGLIKQQLYIFEVLEKNQNSFLKDSRVSATFIKTISQYESDFYKFSLLQNAIKTSNELTEMPSSQDIMGISKSINSENYIAKLCYSLIEIQGVNKSLDQILKLYNQINHEEFYSNNVIRKVLTQPIEFSQLKKLLVAIQNSPQKESNNIVFYEHVFSNNSYSENQTLEILSTIPKNTTAPISLYKSMMGVSKIISKSSQKVKGEYQKIALQLKPDYEFYYDKVINAIRE